MFWCSFNSKMPVGVLSVRSQVAIPDRYFPVSGRFGVPQKNRYLCREAASFVKNSHVLNLARFLLDSDWMLMSRDLRMQPHEDEAVLRPASPVV